MAVLIRRLAASLSILVLVAQGLMTSGTAAQPSPAGPSPAGPSPAETDTLVVGFTPPGFAPSPFILISNTTTAGIRPELPTQLVYNGLYRYDATLSPVPDLAAEPCTIADDEITITCRLVEARFHDGKPLTARDVAYTFELGRRHPDCLWAFGECFGDALESVDAIDDRTVRFTLTGPDATFLTLVLPRVMIDSRAVIEAAYAPFAERAPGLDAAAYVGSAEAIDAQLAAEDPDCEAPLADAAALLEAAAIEPMPRDLFGDREGAFDACAYAFWTAVMLRAIAASLGATGLDAVALAYPALSFQRAPVGTGPWRFAGVEDGTRGIFEAYEGYHRGPPAIGRVEIRVIRDPAVATASMRRGEIHWLGIAPFYPEIARDLRDEPGVRFATFPSPAYYMLAYNLREGRLFADRDLRSAMALCVDKAATVDAATDGTGDVLYSPIDPVSWAYESDVPRQGRDVAAARQLIEASGWVEGDDGVYVRDGRRLAADVFVSSLESQRVEFMDLVAAQVRACGIELTVVPADPETVLDPVTEYPHVPGGYEDPFDAIFIGWTHGLDPHDDLWHSRSVSSPEQPRGLNFMGFSDPRVDELLDRGVATYDQRERAQIYREFQRLIADEHPVLFGWSARIEEALDVRLGSTAGELDLGSPFWHWQLEHLTLREAAGT